MYNLNKVKTLGEVRLTLLGDGVPELHFYNVVQHRRLKVFFNKGTKCANPDCDRIGTRLLINELQLKRTSQIHVDIFTDDDVLMTVDHKVPISKDGAFEDLSNLQPMCTHCNTKKGNQLILT